MQEKDNESDVKSCVDWCNDDLIASTLTPQEVEYVKAGALQQIVDSLDTLNKNLEKLMQLLSHRL